MTLPQTLVVELLSPTTSTAGGPGSRGADVDIATDDLGLPVIPSTVLSGLLRDTWESMTPWHGELPQAAGVLFPPARGFDDPAVHIRSARVHPSVRERVARALNRDDDPLTGADILDAATHLRRQTAVARDTGAARDTSLRAIRSALPGTRLHAPLLWLREFDDNRAIAGLLALCALSTRHAGLGRTRGGGHIRITLDGDLAATRQAAEALR